MDTVQITKILIAFMFFVSFGNSLEVAKHDNQTIARHCSALYYEPYFDITEVIGTWKIYYIWNVSANMTDCTEITFKNATPAIIKRIYHDVTDYLEQQPNWDAATLHLSIGKDNHEVLLIAEQGPAGTFVGVPNVIREGNIPPSKNAIPIIKFFIKLIDDGRYLLIIDCNNISGLASLSAKREPEKEEFDSAISTLSLGPGRFTCAFT